jgi:hypothetical protein
MVTSNLLLGFLRLPELFLLANAVRDSRVFSRDIYHLHAQLPVVRENSNADATGLLSASSFRRSSKMTVLWGRGCRRL